MDDLNCKCPKFNIFGDFGQDTQQKTAQDLVDVRFGSVAQEAGQPAMTAFRCSKFLATK